MLQNRKMTEFKLIIIIVMNERDEGKAVGIKKRRESTLPFSSHQPLRAYLEKTI